MPKAKTETIKKSKKTTVVESMFSKKANLLKIQEDLIIDNGDDIIGSIEDALTIKGIENDDDENEFSESEFINNGEKEYIQSLKSSIYTEAFQKELLKMIQSALDNISDKRVYKKIIQSTIDLIIVTTTKSKISNSDNMFFALNDLLNELLNETKENAKIGLQEIQEVIKENIIKYKEINEGKKKIIEITLKAQNGDSQAEGEVIDYMMKEITKSARKISSYNSGGSMDSYLFDDLVQEGLIGVLRGIQKFKPSKSDNVKAYMKFWVTQSMLSHITNKCHAIRIPAHVRQLYIKITRKIDEFAGENIEFTTKHIADEMGIDEDKVKMILEKGKMGNVMNMSDIATFMGGEDDEMSIDSMSFMEDHTMGVHDDMVFNEEILELQDSIKKILTDEEQMVIIHRFGLFGSDKLLLKDLGEKLGKTEERVRQIETRALNTLSINYFDKKYGKNFREVMKSKGQSLTA